MNTYITFRLPYLKNIIWNFLDICTSITIFQKTSFIRRKMAWMVIFYVCADASTKKVLLHSYVKNQTNNFSKFLVNRFVWWETDWFLFEVCGAHRDIWAISNIFYLPTYIWKESMFILYWAPRMISPFPYIEHANFRLLICLFHFNNNEGYPNFYWH